MQDKPEKISNGTAVALKTDGNPEGKGVNRLLRDWHDSAPRLVVAKPRQQVLAEFFTSMLVLAARFSYQPVVGAPNYLYWSGGEWLLSLIAPDEWSDEKRACFAGTCVLQPDRTWTIEPSGLLAERNAVSEAVARFYDAFAHMLDSDLTLEDVLPVHVNAMPYYQRLNASALSRSIRGSMALGEQTSILCRDWRATLPVLDRMLPSPES
jgi:hypothetical protein